MPNILKVAVIGPESTGKSTLCEALAKHFNTLWVPEFAREYLTNSNGLYHYHDLVHIAKQQKRREDDLAAAANRLLFCDTDLHNIVVWSQHVFGTCDPWLIDAEHKQDYRFYLLMKPDIPWELDALRENPGLRKKLFNTYEHRLKKMGRQYAIIDGQGIKRIENAAKAICFLAK